jgi:hypothetical protein
MPHMPHMPLAGACDHMAAGMPVLLQVLEASKVLKIEDILPFFPDFSKIDAFQVRP